MRCRELDVRYPREAAAVLACQRAGYAVEAELIVSTGTANAPALALYRRRPMRRSSGSGR